MEARHEYRPVVIAGPLAMAFAGAGLMKLAQPKEKLASSVVAWGRFGPYAFAS